MLRGGFGSHLGGRLWQSQRSRRLAEDRRHHRRGPDHPQTPQAPGRPGRRTLPAGVYGDVRDGREVKRIAAAALALGALAARKGRMDETSLQLWFWVRHGRSIAVCRIEEVRTEPGPDEATVRL